MARASVRVAAVCLPLVYVALSTGSMIVLADVTGRPPFPIIPLIFAAYPLMGALILWQRGSHLVGWLMTAIGIVILVMISSGPYAVYALQNHPGSLPFGQVAVVLNGTAWAVGILLFACLLPMTFPTGRLLSRRWLVVVCLAVLYALLAGAANGLIPGSHIAGHPRLINPIGWSGHTEILTRIADLSILPGGAALFGVVASMVVRYRRSRGVERQQLKFFLFVACLIPIPLITHDMTDLSNAAFLTILPMLAISIGLAVLRYGLYEIELVISRTLVYGAMAAFITAVYVAIVVGAGNLLGGGGRPNLALSILATAVVAVAFQPVRERLQRIANHLVYGKRATPYEVLSEFSARVAETYTGAQVLPRMAQVLAEGTGAERAEVWLRSGNTLREGAWWPVGVNGGDRAVELTGQLLPQVPKSDRTVPVRYQGELLGALSVRKRPGESLTPIEEKLLDDLAHQAGLVLKNVGLTSDLQARLEDLRASRQRLVAAQDQERRKLERNLHDGAQQNLVALKVKLGLAEMLTARDPDRARALVTELQVDADEALQTLRDLARGIYPPLLADQGLEAALRAQARKASLPVTVDAAGVGRHSQEVEAAVYFVCLEALQNVQKYARASHATVRLRDHAGQVTFEVTDDGVGFNIDTVGWGSGLQNMQDRLEALGGTVRVRSRPGATVVGGSLPTPIVKPVALVV